MAVYICTKSKDLQYNKVKAQKHTQSLPFSVNKL